jgi:RimJ/RimL family protein N-acetyltransferase
VNDPVWLRFSWRLRGRAFSYSVAPGYAVRIAQRDEIDSVIACALAAYASDPTWTGILKNIEQRLSARIRATLGAPGVHYAVAVKGDEICGVSAASLERHDGHNLITGTCVSSKHQGKGLGIAVLGDCLTWLRDQGLEEAQVYTDPAAVAAQRVYPRFDAKCEPAPGYRAPERA